jgi:hypothetical protein
VALFTLAGSNMEERKLSILSTSRLQQLDERAHDRKKRIHRRSAYTKKLQSLAAIRNAQNKIKVLNEKQRHMIALLTDFTRQVNRDQVCEEVQITTNTYTKWRNDPFFLQELDKEISRRRTFPRLEAMRHVFRQVNRGNMRVIRDFLKMTGDYKEKVELTSVPVEELPEEQLDQEIERLSSELGIEVTE